MNDERIFDETDNDPALRPRSLEEYVGQDRIKSNLRVYIQAAIKRGEALDHVLFAGPPGLGKTSLAYILGEELGVEVRTTSGPVIERGGDLAAILNNLEDRQILFIDEIHRLNRAVEEILYPAMEDYEIDVVLGTGPGAQSVKLPLRRFTLVGATTRAGLLTSPLRARFGIQCTMDFYSAEELDSIVRRSAERLGVAITADGAKELSCRCRGTPRVANRVLKRVRDFAEVEGTGTIDLEIARNALARLGIDAMGLDDMDRRILEAIAFKFDHGPVGLTNLAAAIGEEADTIESVYEPFLIQQGLVQRTPRGRIITRRGLEHLGVQSAADATPTEREKLFLILLLLACSAKKTTLPTQAIDVDGTRVKVEIADDPAERHQGLMYRDSMGDDAGMLFVYPDTAPRSFWMENTRIPLSIAYLDETGRIVNIEDMTPFDRTGVKSAAPAMYALEMNQGWFVAHEVERGDVVTGLPGPSPE